MGSRGDVGRQQHSTFFTAEQREGFTILRFKASEELPGTDLQEIETLWDFLDAFRASGERILLIIFPPGNLSPAVLDRFWEHIRQIPPNATIQQGDKLEWIERQREQYAFWRFIEEVRQPGIFVVAAFQGEIDMEFFGLLLACDYRIAGDDAVFVNRFLELGIPAGAALPWLLARNVGCARAVDILLEGERLTAKQAHKLRLVNRLARPDALEAKALAVAERFASVPSDGLIAIKKAMRSAVCDLAPYFDQEGMGIEHLPKAQPEE